jgi:hypothetical protein
MKKGNQNQSCAADLVHTTCPEGILPRIYPGSFSSVIDASKFFHIFLTMDEGRKFMGLIHPDTEDHYWYTRLPMGSSNSPEVSGRFGVAFLSLIFQEVEEMQGEVLINDGKVALEGKGFDPTLGIGILLIGSDGIPVCFMWIHVDGIFLHGPTRAKCTSDLKKILDLTVLVGLICHPTKLKPHAQIQNFCGFIYDSVGTPMLEIPDNKVVRALALLEFRTRDSRTVLCPLALAVVVGTLQLLVPANQNAIESSFLHHVYRNIHNATLENFDDIQHFYHSGLALRDLVQAYFSWREQALASCLREKIQPRDFCTLGVAWGYGSGSGSGSGGNFEWVDSGKGALPKMEAWMGAWNGTVNSFTSNWRELRTVVETLKREKVVFNKLNGRMVFYFTDNEITYNICKKGSSKTLSLHILVQQLKALELTLGCRLEVIHVSGTTMITQGTDGLSRGIWANGSNTDFNTDFKYFAVEVFLPAFPSPSLT